MNKNGAIQIDQGNFRVTRESYGISIRDVAKKCHFSTATVYNFEHCSGKYTDVFTRPGNAKIMIRALYDCIDEKLAGLFVQKETIKKEEETVKKSNFENIDNSCLKNAVNKLMVRNAVIDYCNSNNLDPYDFLKMCDVTRTILYDYKNHPYVYKSTVDKILAATGWSMDYIEKYKDTTEPIQYIKIKREPYTGQSTNTFVDIPNVVDTGITINTINTITDECKKINQKLYFEDGKFYEEYDHIVTVHEKKEVTKEEFLEAVKEV